MMNPDERASMNVHGGGPAGKLTHRSSWSPCFSKAAEQLVLAVASVRWWLLSSGSCTTRMARLVAVCVAAALLAAAVVVLSTAGTGAAPNPNEMPASFFDDGKGTEDISPSNLTGDHLLDGLLTPELSYRSCRSRYEFARYHKRSSHKPSPYLLTKLRKQEMLQKRCGPGTTSHKEALRRLEAGEGADTDNNSDDCRYLVYISYQGLGNRMLAIVSAFLYAVLTDRVLLIDGDKDMADLFCEPFPGTTWLLPRTGLWQPSSPLRRLKTFDGESKESLGYMLQSGAVSGDNRNVSWSSVRTPPYVYLHLDGSYGFHDKLFFCGAHQRLLRGVPWLLMRTDNYIVPGLFLMSSFQDDLERMFPEKDTAFYHIGRYLFHPTNAVWHAVTSYYHSNLAGVGRRVGVQIRVFNSEPPQHVLDQLLSCVRDEKLLLPKTPSTNSTSILVTSLSSWYYERIRGEYGGSRVHQPSHEGMQRSGDAVHDMRALSEIFLLTTCDVLVTSGFSTFGYVAQGLAGLRPWVMARTPWWAKDWREGLDPEGVPCRRMASVEPCFQVPSAYDCAAGRDIDLDKVKPYIRHCVDVSWGIKLVNETSGRW